MDMKITDKPILQDFHLSGVKHVLPEDAMEAHKTNEAILIDVRARYEISAAQISDVLNLPMQEISSWISGLSKEQNMIFFCSKGIRSAHVVNFLLHEGYTSALNMDGGISAWKARNLPYLEFGRPRNS
jgi:rhodanese-related sulfurtransferase